MCGLRLRSLPRPFLAFGGHPTVTVYPLRFSTTPAMAPCLPQFCFLERSAHPAFRAEVTIPRASYVSGLGVSLAPPGLVRCCAPPRHRGDALNIYPCHALVKPLSGTSLELGGLGGGQYCPETAVWGKPGRFGAVPCPRQLKAPGFDLDGPGPGVRCKRPYAILRSYELK